ncbi:hypothetical protein H7I53_13930 [Mycolicibacterium pulveris]|uniref:hypothetical protein n=1 Tax=Mycolicibacterium pulveris TaxID=36813 RepID=UPI0013D7972D|nr:hypothetical protein [Mycolicibacterium pulveris]MCV6981322.1 hypothetical protein [Mycolicibacterium pulveris]
MTGLIVSMAPTASRGAAPLLAEFGVIETVMAASAGVADSVRCGGDAGGGEEAAPDWVAAGGTAPAAARMPTASVAVNFDLLWASSTAAP